MSNRDPNYQVFVPVTLHAPFADLLITARWQSVSGVPEVRIFPNVSRLLASHEFAETMDRNPLFFGNVHTANTDSMGNVLDSSTLTPNKPFAFRFNTPDTFRSVYVVWEVAFSAYVVTMSRPSSDLLIISVNDMDRADSDEFRGRKVDTTSMKLEFKNE